MRLFINIITVLMSFGIICHAYGGHPNILQSPLSKLLDSPLITSIFRDSKGLLWIGTQDGLYKFDGAKLTRFNSDKDNPDWIPTSEIRDIAEDLDQNILVATHNKGLLQWNRHSGMFESVSVIEATSENELRKLHVAKDGRVWLAAAQTVILYEPRLGSVSEWPALQTVAAKIGRPYAFLEDESGNIFIGGSLGLTKLSPDSHKIDKLDLKKLQIEDNVSITALEFDKNQNLLIGTDKGYIASMDARTGDLIGRLNLGERTPKFITELISFNERLIIGSDAGMYLSDTALTYLKKLDSLGLELSHKDIYDLYIDRQHIWIGTYGGLDILSFAQFELFNQKNSDVDNDILAITEDDYDQIWIGTYNGLYQYDSETGLHIKFESPAGTQGLIDQRISALANKGNHLWLGFFQGGLQAIDLLNGSSFVPDMEEASDTVVTSIVADEMSPHVWIATSDFGLFRITGKNIYSYYRVGSLAEKTIELIFSTKQGRLFVAAPEHIYEYDLTTDSFSPIDFNFGEGKRKPRLLSIARSSRGDIWIGSKDNGLYRFSAENQNLNNFSFEKVGGNGELELLTVYGIEEDKMGNLWCSSHTGVVKLDSEGRFIEKFTTVDGLQGSDFTVGASFSSRNGLIYFGGANGYNRFNPIEIETDSSPSQMHLAGTYLSGEYADKIGAVRDLKSLHLDHNDRFVTFQFSVLDLIHPERNQYRYMLEGFDTDWIENGTRNTATYTNLPSGDYLFRVQGANAAGIWNREGLSIDVHVLPPPWRTWWAYCLYVMAFAVALWCAHRIYQSYAIKRQSVELAKEMFEAENRADDDMQEQLELQDELVESAYTHNLATLSLVASCIAQQSQSHTDDAVADYSEGNINRISALSSLEDCLFYQAGGPVANLQKYTDSIISKLLPQAPVNTDTIITINEVPARLMSAELASPLAIIIYELLENCIQHAFEEDSPANYIHITLESKRTDKSLECNLHLCVRDSGIGISGSIEDLLNENSGIAIVQAIVSRLGGTLKATGNSGTVVTAIIPEPTT